MLDLFCGAGGAAMGYYQAGFEVVGVDNRPQPHFPFEFHQADAFEFLAAHGSEYCMIHASPPCQFGSEATPMAYRDRHPNYIPRVRELLREIGRPFVIENVENVRSWLTNPIMLCGTMFGLGVWRHRYFEINPSLPVLTPPCYHNKSPVTLCKAGSNSRKTRRLPVLITGTTRKSYKNGGRFEFTVQECRDASELYWMTRKEMDEAIPPAYTRYIGRLLLESAIWP